MSITVSVLPDARTTVEVADDPMDPPSLIVGAGPIEVVIAPAGVAGGMEAAVSFARELVQAVITWEQLCIRQLTLADSADPLDIDAIMRRLTVDGGQSG